MTESAEPSTRTAAGAVVEPAGKAAEKAAAEPRAADSAPRRRGRPRSSTPALLEAAAVAVFEQKGYDHTSIDDVTVAAGVSRSTLFRYVSSKGGLLWLHKPLYDQALAASLAGADASRPVVDVITDALVHTLTVELTQRGLELTEILKAKWRIVASAQGPAEVSMAVRLEWGALIRDYVESMLGENSPEVVVGGLPHAFVGAAFSACVHWAQSPADGTALAAVIREGLHPLRLGYGPLLEPLR